ncbi:undecaprenyl phosphate-alpha-4-amino-4-deoxy-L-arabinose arabinosyl transferase [Desulfomarina profundi]|uniref:Undecaprenyl phosphate-alpha-4-amino-4-deoxy-L-arabinose arabinosyl transferase n=1 Tax=Desulfomarina profundi TaxID=2772557 RepID=A0A8D5FUP9_9BACT|nr:phospholipid carrier-dependent glycosyltransferase [Desulfomarina profundi]BCL61706.1 undecaprenyl phosphate-alpha-4-amino-4-deoxy-L-arabinose arabinosyl transferase [Desulfomarina profundi]
MTRNAFSFLLLFLFIGLYLAPLGQRPLIIPDETRYAEIPREMVATGDWTVPRINGGRYFEKPVLGYWLTAISLTVFGENNFAVRFPQAASTGLTALLVFLLCMQVKRNDTWFPWLAALIYLTSLSVLGIGTFAVLDPLFSFFLSGCLILFFLAAEKIPGSNSERIFLFAAGILAGLAFLTKGFLACAIPVLVVAPYLLIRKRPRDMVRMVWIPILGAVLVSLPWCIRIYLREPDFWHFFFWNEHIRRFLSENAQHRHPFWIFAASLPGMFLPWTLLFPSALIGLRKKQWKNWAEYRLYLFCCCWFFLPFLFFSLSKGKLVTYILPCFPPLAVLFALGLDHILRNRRIKHFFQHSVAIAALLVFLALVTLVELYFFWPENYSLFRHTYQWLLLGSTFSVMLILLFVTFRAKNMLKKTVLFSFAFTILFVMVNFTLPDLTLQRKAPGELIRRNARFIKPDTFVLAGEQAVRAVCWYLKRHDVLMIERAGELRYGLKYEDSNRSLLSPHEAAMLIKKHPGRVVLIADTNQYKQWKHLLPSPVSIDSNGKEGYLLLTY